MKSEPTGIRSAVIDCVSLFASAAAQAEYEREVPHESVPVEMIEIFATDLYHPKSQDFVDSFSESELKSMSRVYGAICSVSESLDAKPVRCGLELQKMPEWRTVMVIAKRLSEEMKRQA